MNSLQQIEYWADHHHPKWLDLIRIILGLLLITKGIAFIFNREEIITMLAGRGTEMSEFVSFYAGHYVIVVLIVGGLFVTIGFITRWALLFQLPAVLGEMFMTDFHKDLFILNSELNYLILLFVLMIFFILYGSGKISFDHWLLKWKEE
ncbi:MAG: DoxX family membrane protein [Ignavibacteriaceae bacterium]